MPRQRNLPLAVLCLSLAALAAGCDSIEDRLMARIAGKTMQASRGDLLDDGKLNLVLCGTGSPLATQDRASACTAILAGGHFFVVDVGPASARNLGVWKLPLERLDGVLLTHFHSDHIGDLGEVGTQSWIAGRKGPLDVYGPPGVERVVGGFQDAYALDRGYRVAHHGESNMPEASARMTPKTVTLPGPDESAVVFDADGLKITAFRVDHTPIEPAYGYRFDYGGRSVVISGDTKRMDNLVRHAQGASVLVQETLATHMVMVASRVAKETGNERLSALSHDITNYHTTPVEAVEMARDAKVEALIMAHLVPVPRNRLAEWIFMRGTSGIWDGEIIVGKDGMLVMLPPSSTTIEVDELEVLS